MGWPTAAPPADAKFGVGRLGELLNGDRQQHVIRVQLHRTAPERSLEDVMDVLSLAHLPRLVQQPRPFKRA